MSLELRGVTVRYPGATYPILDAFDLVVEKGRSLALMGPSGAGKSTALAVAGLLLSPDSGEVWIGGRRHDANSASHALTHEVAWILQTVNLLPRRSALDNVVLPALAAGGSRVTAERRAVDLLDAVGITNPDQSARTLSGGQAQRVGVARALMNRPAVLIADEPTANLDLATGREVASVILQAATSTTILLATHDPDVAAMAHEVRHLEPIPHGHLRRHVAR